jgi:hypothetical protein
VQGHPTEYGIGSKRTFGRDYNFGIWNNFQEHLDLCLKRGAHIACAGDLTAKGSEKVSVDVGRLYV